MAGPYYVHTGGSDSNNGLGPDPSAATNKPFLTIGKALSVLAAGETAYVRPGRYAEVSVSPTNSGTSGNQISLVGDTEGTYFGSFGVKGAVIWSAFTAGDDSAPTGTPLTLNQKDFWTFDSITFHGDDASASCVNTATPTSAATQSTDITFQKCVFFTQSGQAIIINGWGSNALNWNIKKCSFFGYNGSNAGAIRLIHTYGTMTANTDLNIQIENCNFVGSTAAFYASTSGYTTVVYRVGGVDMMSCTIAGATRGFFLSNANFASAVPCTVTNTLVMACTNSGLNTAGTDGTSAATGSLSETYNRIIDCGTGTVNTTGGTGTVQTGIFGIDAGGSAIQKYANRMYFMPPISGIVNGDGTSTGQPSDDILSYSRTGTTTIGAYLDTDTCPATGGLLVHPGMTGGIRG